jgi:DNA primase
MRSNIDIIKENLPLLTYLESTGHNLKKAGSNIYRLDKCPCCGHSGCFNLHEDTDSWYCWSCGKGGDIIRLLIESNQVADIRGAVEMLSSNFSIKIEYTKAEIAEHKIEDKREEIFSAAYKIFQAEFKSSKEAQEYLSNRGRDKKIIDKIGYGFSSSWTLLTNSLKDKYTEEELVSTGLVHKDKKTGRLYDYFGAGRVIYPIIKYKKLCSFFGKPIDKKDSPLHLKKEFVLRNAQYYGEDNVYKDCLLVEGQEDYVAAVQSGFKKVAAIQGNFAPGQLSKLKRSSSPLYLCFDLDAKGYEYIKQVIKEIGHIRTVYVIDLSQFYLGLTMLKLDLSKFPYIDSWIEALEDRDVDGYPKKVNDLADFMNYAKYDSKIIPELIRTAVPGITYLVNQISELDRSDKNLLIQRVNPIIEVIANIEDELLQCGYTDELSRKLGKSSLGKNIASLVKKQYNQIQNARLTDAERDEKVVSFGIQRRNNSYIRVKGEEEILLMRFVINLKRLIETDDEDGKKEYVITLTNDLNVSTLPITMSGPQRLSRNKFRDFVSCYPGYHITHKISDEDLDEIWSLEETRTPIGIVDKEVMKYGYLEKENLWLFENSVLAGNDLYLPKDGEEIIHVNGVGYRSSGVNIFSGDKPKICLQGEVSKAFTLKIVSLFWKMMDARDGEIDPPHSSFTGFLLMGYIAGNVYLPELMNPKYGLDKAFPFLALYGPSGTGKTEVAQLLQNVFGFVNGGESWSGSTQAGIVYAMEQLSCLPFWIEEYKNVRNANNYQKAKIELLNGIYNRNSKGTGALGGKRSTHKVLASLMFTGQDRPTEGALESRCIMIMKNVSNLSNTSAYLELKVVRDKLPNVLRYLIGSKTQSRVEELIKNFKIWQAVIKDECGSGIEARIIHNYALMGACFSVYDYHDYDTEFKDWIIEQAIMGQERREESNVVYEFFESINSIPAYRDLRVVLDFEGIGASRKVFMALKQIHLEWTKNSGDRNEYIDYRTLREYLKSAQEGFFVKEDESKPHRFNDNKQYRCISLMVNKLPSELRDLVNMWDDEITGRNDKDGQL